MGTWLKVYSAIVIGHVIGAIHYQSSKAESNSSVSGDEIQSEMKDKPLIIAWIEKPPYMVSPSNGHLEKKFHGMIRDVLLRHIGVECGLLLANTNYQLDALKLSSELDMIELLRQNKVHIAAPIMEDPINRRYSEFPFLKLDDYPGTQYITTEDDTSALSVVLDTTQKSWPLFLITLVITAISGVIMWALDTYWNSEEFPRSFIRGAWEGFWWSFISMTTVGYGDKSPRSIAARVFSIIWIMSGLIITAIFTATVTSALTAASLETGPSSLAGLKVAVLGNGTEYQQALEEGAQPEVHQSIDGIIQALKIGQVHGMLLDSYTASYYQDRDKLKALLTVGKFGFRRDVGVLFSKDREDLATCLSFYRSAIWRLVQTITDTFKLTPQKSTNNFSLLDDSSPYVKQSLYISLGILGGLLFTGTMWDVFIRKKDNNKKDVILESVVCGWMPSAKETIRNDLETARALNKQMEERLNKLEAEMLRFQDGH